MHLFRTACLFIFLVLGAGGLFAEGNATNISAAEYFVDTDPGEGNATALTAQDGAFDSEVEAIASVDLNVSGLSVGPHLIGIRYKDDNNTWGDVLYQTIHVYDANPSGGGSGGSDGGGSGGSSVGFATITGAEYFVDTDPGEGNGTAFQPKDGAFDSEVESILPKDLNVTGLSVGPHLVGVRYKDNNNTWGDVLYQTIHVYDANPSGSGSGGSDGGGSGGSSVGFATITAAEYFVDTDPGEGSGTAFQPKDGAFDSEVESILPKDLNVTGLSVGPHLVGVRYKDNNNTWGDVLYQTIHVYDANPSGSGSGGSGGGSGGSSVGFATITGAEYFVDTDPGEGNGTAFQPKDGAFDSEVESILPKDLNVTGLSVGPHLVGVRYKDNNNWGDVLYQTIHVYDANPDANGTGSGGTGVTGGFSIIAGAEYFIGEDPGEGNATALQPKDGAFDSEVESTLAVNLSLDGYAIGSYLVGVRYKDNNGTWGDVLFKSVEVDVDTDGDGLADKAEAYYETNSTQADTDGDGYSDGEEVAFGSDPTDPNSLGNQPPKDLNSTAVLAFQENQPAGTIIGEFNATDPDGHEITYSLVPFSPAQVSPTLWLDASDEATLVKESGVLSGWLDKSGNNRNGSSTGSLRPSISTGFNGYSMVNLDGVDDIVSINGSFALNTFFVVLNSEISSEKFPKWAWVLGARGPDKTFQMVPALYGRMGGSSLTTELPFQGNQQSVISINGDDTLSQNTQDFGNFSEFKLISVSSNQSSSILSNWKISSGEFPWKGNIAEIVIFDRPLEDHQRYSMEEYLSSKWGLSSEMYRPYVPSNSLFNLDTNGTLKTATTFDYESNASIYTITVLAKDDLNATTEGNFTVTLLNVVEDKDQGGVEDHNESDDDNDGFSNKVELESGTDPNDPFSLPKIPILETFDARLDKNNTFVLSGRVLESGDANVTDFGIIISTSIDYSSGYWIRGKGNPEAFRLKLADSNLTGTIYYRSWAKNVAGYGVGPVKKVEIPAPTKGWWGESRVLTKGWVMSDWFGLFRTDPSGWIYHEEMNWIYHSESADDSVWLWKKGRGWLWTKEKVWPYLWSNRKSNWLYFIRGNRGRPLYFDYSSNSYEED
jgi:hypothetical protein